MYPGLPPHATAAPRNGLGTAGFVLGLLALLFSFIPIIGVIAWPLGIVGLVLGVIGIIRARNGLADNQGMAITGTALAGVGLLVCVAWLGVLGTAANEVAVQSESAGSELQPGPVPVDSAPADSAAQASELDFGGTHVWRGGESVQVLAPQEHRSSNPYLIDPESRGVAVELVITNGTDDEINPITWEVTATHGGRPAGFALEDDPFTNVQIPPGDTLTITRLFQVSSEPGELRISVAPSSFAADTAYFHGEF